MPANLAAIVKKLQRKHGAPKPRHSDPWSLVLLENVAYLVDDQKRESICQKLKQHIGIKPTELLSAAKSDLFAIVGGGMLKEQQVEKLLTCATIALDEFGGNVNAAARLPLPRALKAFKKFPGIGATGAARILLLSGSHPVYAMESNGVRVLVRLGFAAEDKNYAKMYRAVERSLAGQLKSDCAWLANLHLLLRTHGQSVCRRSLPECHECPLASDCAFCKKR
jgi:endonuclease III